MLLPSYLCVYKINVIDIILSAILKAAQMVGYGEQLDTLISWVSVQLQSLGIFYVYINVIDIILSAILKAVQIVGYGEQLVTLIS